MLAATTIGRRQITRLIILLVTAGLFGGCARKKSADLVPDSRMWLIESYDHGTITAKWGDKTYNATCEGHRILGPDQFYWDVAPSFPCSMAIEAVGTSVEADTINTDYNRLVLVMGRGFAGSLILRRGPEIETFTITSVTKTDQ